MKIKLEVIQYYKLLLKDKILFFIFQVTFDKFILFDLTRSEKIQSASKTNLESRSINKSLLALTNYINKLVSNNKIFILLERF